MGCVAQLVVVVQPWIAQPTSSDGAIPILDDVAALPHCDPDAGYEGQLVPAVGGVFFTGSITGAMMATQLLHSDCR